MPLARLALAVLALPCALAAQERVAVLGAPRAGGAAVAATSTANAAVATRTAAAPVIDGKEDDPIWAQAQLIDGFRQFVPEEDGAPTFRTTAKVAYDQKYLYVFVRMYDPHPDSIIALLSRHDVKTQSDWIKIIIDSYHDRRSGYEFAVNPRGVKRDYYTYNDSEEDESWDGIWDVATRVDSAGWTAEFRIPWSQLRYAPGQDLTMGLAFARDIARLNERDSWPVYRRSKPGIASQLGEISGLDGLGSPRQLEVVPYVVTKNISYPNADGTAWGRQQDFTAGADLKYGVTSNLTLDGTINPDFGQVESDPAVLNLSNFETFLPEKRPFFVEGTGTFRLDMSCNNGACSGLFYSRRIGRQPQLSDGSASTPTVTTILGAAKLTGRLSGGLTLGVLDALTERAQNADGSTAEPGTNYFAGRVLQELRDGQTGIGAMITATNRELDPTSAPYLRQAAYAGGVDFRHQFDQRHYELAGFAIGSTVTGSDSAMMLTQLSSTHYYQRPGSGLTFDTAMTRMTGDAERISLSKIGGGITRFYSGFTHVSPGFEINDLGYLAEAGRQSWSNWFGWQLQEPTSWYRQLYLNVNAYGQWTAQGITGEFLSSTSSNINASAELKSGWWANAGFEVDNFGSVYDDRKARGGPAMFRRPFINYWAGFQGDPRLHLVPNVSFYGFNGAQGHSHGWGVDPSLLMTMSSSLAVTVGLHYDLNVDYTQWVNNYVIGADTVYTFGWLDQNTVAATVRVDATFTPKLSFQFYAQPFISQGKYTDWRSLVQPRAHEYDQQFAPFAMADSSIANYDFDYQQLNINAVLRWEYRNGSAIYLVWTHGRNLYAAGQQYSGFSPGTDVQSLVSIHPMNTFLVKVSYWLGI